MLRRLNLVGILCLALSLGAFAQDNEGAQKPVPVPALSGSGTNEIQEEQPYSVLHRDSTSGADFQSRSYIIARFEASYLYDSYSGDSSGVPTGNLSLVNRRRVNDTEIAYTGGATIHSDLSAGDWQYHRLVIAETFHAANWRLTLADQFEYLPESPYGNSAYGGTDPLMSFLMQFFLPDQSYLTAGSKRVTNAAIAQGEKTISRAVSVHGSFVNSFLQYPESGYVGYRTYQGSGGLQRQIGQQSSFSLDYTGGLTHFGGGYRMLSHQLALKYTHSFKKRAVLELSGGPEAVLLKNSLYQIDKTKMLIDGRASFRWQVKRTDATLSYSHGSGSGGGLVQGAEEHTALVSISRRVGRVWTVGLHDGYTHAEQLTGFLTMGTPITYQSAYAGASLNRDIGRSITFFVSYDYQYQTESQLALPGTLYHRHMVMAGFKFNFHPIALE